MPDYSMILATNMRLGNDTDRRARNGNQFLHRCRNQSQLVRAFCNLVGLWLKKVQQHFL